MLGVEATTLFKLSFEGSSHPNRFDEIVKVVPMLGVKHNGIVSEALEHDVFELLRSYKLCHSLRCAGSCGGCLVLSKRNGSNPNSFRVEGA